MERPSVWPRVGGLLAIVLIAAVFIWSGLWTVGVAVALVGALVFNALSHRQVRRVKARYAAAGVEPDFSADQGKVFRRLAVLQLSVLALFLVLGIVLIVVAAVH